MEGEVRTEENKVSLDVNKKRTVKTQTQINALEDFYKDHKFLSDEMKAQLAVQISLTEKQISSWFCHRRLKDKRKDESFANGRQDHSSGVIQDRGSGHRQDSCCSIKQGDYWKVDPREVESQRVPGYDFPAADLTYERRNLLSPAPKEDTSSESTSSLHDHPFSETRDPYDMKFSVNLTQNGAVTQINPKCSKSMHYKPSGYLKVKGETENPAITAVKRQLGRHYREDGPLLGIEFDRLPSGAFEFPSNNHFDAEPMHVEDSLQAHSTDISRMLKRPNLNNINEVHTSKMSSHDSRVEATDMNSMYGSERQDRKSRSQSKYKSSSHRSNPFPGRNSFDIYEGSSGKTAGSDCRVNMMTSKTAVEMMGSDSFLNLPKLYDGKIVKEQLKPWLLDADVRTGKTSKNKNLCKTSNLSYGYSELLSTERGLSAVMVEKESPEWNAKLDYLVGVRGDPTKEWKVPKRVKGKYAQQDFVANASPVRLPVLTNPTKGPSSTDVPSSFIEDETAETSSSLD